ncbi:hypothetical protein Tco_1432463 [Tanacetum coccineum]
MGKNTGQKEIRPVWNSVPSAVLTRSGRVPVSVAKQSSLRATTSTSTFKPVNTTTHTNRVNVSKLKTNAFHKSHSHIRRVNGVNTAGQTTVSVVKGNGVTAVKASTCCVWRPKMIDLNSVSKDNSVSWVSKRVNYIDPQGRLKHMIGKKTSLLTIKTLMEVFLLLVEMLEMVKIHTNNNVADLLTKAFDVRIRQKSQENRQKRSNTKHENGRACKSRKPKSKLSVNYGSTKVNHKKTKPQKVPNQSFKFQKITQMVLESYTSSYSPHWSITSKNDTLAGVEAQRMMGFVLKALTMEAQMSQSRIATLAIRVSS